MDAQAGRVRPTRAVRAGRGLFGDLVAHVIPAAQGAGEPRAGTGVTGPAELGAHEAGRDGLIGPLEGHVEAQDALQGPFDVRAQRRWGGVNEHHPAGHDA